jgi:hypothetical protein
MSGTANTLASPASKARAPREDPSPTRQVTFAHPEAALLGFLSSLEPNFGLHMYDA